MFSISWNKLQQKQSEEYVLNMNTVYSIAIWSKRAMEI